MPQAAHERQTPAHSLYQLLPQHLGSFDQSDVVSYVADVIDFIGCSVGQNDGHFTTGQMNGLAVLLTACSRTLNDAARIIDVRSAADRDQGPSDKGGNSDGREEYPKIMPEGAPLSRAASAGK